MIANKSLAEAQAVLHNQFGNISGVGTAGAAEDEALALEGLQAQQADAILSNPLFNAVFDDCIAELRAAWENSEPRDHEGREMAWHRIRALFRVREALTGRIAQGKLAAAQRRINSESQSGGRLDAG